MTDFEITSEMIDAGLECLTEHWREWPYGERRCSLLLADVFRAMRAAEAREKLDFKSLDIAMYEIEQIVKPPILTFRGSVYSANDGKFSHNDSHLYTKYLVLAAIIILGILAGLSGALP